MKLTLLIITSSLSLNVCMARSSNQAHASVMPTNNEVLTKLVGEVVRMDPDITARVLRDEPGKRHYVDTKGVGKSDVLYLIDTDERHEKQCRPILVKIVDEDGDMHVSGRGDLDSDLYIADWLGDGSIDRVIDYVDHDHDNDQDEQVQYWYVDADYVKNSTTRHRGGWLKKDQYPKVNPGRDFIVSWARDYGDDNRLWWDINYDYEQRLTQWRSDYNDEMLVNSFWYDYAEHRLTPPTHGFSVRCSCLLIAGEGFIY